MTLYDDYRNTDYLDDVSFIAGTDFMLEFPIYDENGLPENITSSTMNWMLSLYGQPEYAILKKVAVSSGSDVFQVNLSSNDTINLGGVYLQQAEIIDVGGKKFRPSQGIVVIRKAIPTT